MWEKKKGLWNWGRCIYMYLYSKRKGWVLGCHWFEQGKAQVLEQPHMLWKSTLALFIFNYIHSISNNQLLPKPFNSTSPSHFFFHWKTSILITINHPLAFKFITKPRGLKHNFTTGLVTIILYIYFDF